MNRSPQDRISAIETLRRIYHGNAGRLQRVISIIRKELIINKKATGRKKDLANLEALGEI